MRTAHQLAALAAVVFSTTLALGQGTASGASSGATNTRTDSTKSPVKPSVRCCCSRDATVPEKSVQLPDAQSLFLPTVPDDLVSLGEQLPTYEAAFIPIDMGLRLHVLLCVWRC